MSQPLFVPQPDDEVDTSYFAAKPRRSRGDVRRAESEAGGRSSSVHATTFYAPLPRMLRRVHHRLHKEKHVFYLERMGFFITHTC